MTDQLSEPSAAEEAEQELGPHTSCGACGGNGCPACVILFDEPDEEQVSE
jgi:Na+-translocating ferredoxin:NAD+ oxidoreductase RNF subunit RnfB